MSVARRNLNPVRAPLEGMKRAHVRKLAAACVCVTVCVCDR